MNIKAYKESHLHEHTLPSGLKIKYKDMSPLSLIQVLADADLSWDAFGKKDEDTKEENANSMTPAQHVALCKAGFPVLLVSPKVPEEIEVTDFESADFDDIMSKLFAQFTVPVGKEESEGEKDFTIQSD